MSAKEKITASLASYPARADQLRVTVASLLPQVDHLNVWLNEYDAIPGYLNHPKITATVAFPTRGDAGKFAWTDQVQGYHLICDDDIIYPADYAHQMIAGVERYHRKAVVGLHAVWIKEPVTSYYKNRKVINAIVPLDKDIPCHLLATNSLAYHTSTLKITPRDFPVPNYADPFFAILTQRQQVPCVALARRAGWITHLHVSESLYEKFSHGDDALHTKIVQLLSPWTLWPLPQ